MTVTVIVQPTQYPGNGTAATFSFTFLITAATDLVVGFIVAGVYTQQLSGYTISGINNAGGGQITFSIAPPLGTTVDLRSLIPETQPTNFANLGPYLPEANTASVDRCVRLIQDLNRLCYQFGIHGPDTESVSWPALPGPAARAGTQLGFDPTTGLPTLVTSPATAFSQALFNAYLATSNIATTFFPQTGDIRSFGAKSGGSPGSGGNGDCTAAILSALANEGTALIPPGDWRADGLTGPIAVNGTGVIFQPGAVITRYSANSSETAPVFWQQASNGSIIGSGACSQIITQNAAPSGIILNGCASMTSDSPLGQDMLLNTVANILLAGKVAYGETSGTPDAAYMQINPQLDGKACYFAALSNVYTQASNFGFWLQGWANGNLMSNLWGKWIGNTTRAVPTAQGADALIFSQGALDNNLDGVFHHFSPSTTTVRIEDYNNTGTAGGSDHITSYSSLRGVICEQGGSAYSLIANGTCTAFANYLEMIDNTSLGYSISAGFTNPAIQANTLITATNGAFFFQAAVGILTPTQLVGVVTAPTYGTSIAINAALGNDFDINVTNGTGFTIANPTNGIIGQEITLTIRNASGTTVGTITWGSLFRMATWNSPANGNSRSITFRLYSTTWVEMSRTTADVPT
jgi:hypothetical protein